MDKRTIIFDLGKVICPFDPRKPCRVLGKQLEKDPEQICQDIFFGEVEVLFETGKIDGDEFTRQCNEILGTDFSTEEFHDIWSDMFEFDPEVVKVVDQLRADHQVMLLSNTNPWHFEHCDERFSIRDHFNDLVLSYEVGYMKPHAGIFQAALEKSVAPHSALFIDDLEPNVVAASELGITSLLYSNVEQLRYWLKAQGVLE